MYFESTIAPVMEPLKWLLCGRATQKEESIAQADEMIATYIRGIMDILTKLGYTQEEILRLAGVYKRVEERNVSGNQFTDFNVQLTAQRQLRTRRFQLSSLVSGF